MQELAAAYYRAILIADKEDSPSHSHLAQVLYDLLTYFSEDGITSEQRERLKVMGFPLLQD
jgi:hypothetical protein